MWQVQWMLSLIPAEILSLIYWIIIAVGITGIAAGWLGRWIPFYGKYVQLLKPIGVLLVVLGVWLRGGYDVEMAWRAKVKDMENKVAIAEEQAKTATAKVETKVVTQTKIVREKGETIVRYVDKVVTQDKEVIKFVEHCPIPPAVVNTINAAAKNQPIEEKKTETKK